MIALVLIAAATVLVLHAIGALDDPATPDCPCGEDHR